MFFSMRLYQTPYVWDGVSRGISVLRASYLEHNNLKLFKKNGNPYEIFPNKLLHEQFQTFVPGRTHKVRILVVHHRQWTASSQPTPQMFLAVKKPIRPC